MNMVRIIMVCSLTGSVILVLICGGITFLTNVVTGIPNNPLATLAIIGEATGDMPAIIEEEDTDMGNRDIRGILKEGIVRRSIEIMRRNGMDDEAIKKKIMESFSLDEEAINKLLRAAAPNSDAG
jgi:hypothetical protein